MSLLRSVTALTVLVVLASGSVAAAATDDAEREAIKSSMVDLEMLGRSVNETYAPFRRGAPADSTRWPEVADIYDAVDRVADGAQRLRDEVGRLQATAGFRPTLPAGEFRRRLAVADSMIVVARDLAASDWQAGRPADHDEARLWVQRRAQRANQIAARTAAAGADVAYAVGVTEGIGSQTLTLSVVGIVVVFVVLAMIAGVVGAIRRLDDGWQEQEKANAAAAVDKEPTIDETTVVLIAAACATVITGRHRVRRIRRLLSPHRKRTPWSAQGRLILQGSHAVGRKKN